MGSCLATMFAIRNKGVPLKIENINPKSRCFSACCEGGIIVHRVNGQNKEGSSESRQKGDKSKKCASEQTVE